MSVGALEPQFFAALIRTLDLSAEIDVSQQMSRDAWPKMREAFTRRFKERTQADWVAVFEKVDACVAPVIPLQSVMSHAHNKQRNLLLPIGDPAPAPRLSRSPARPANSRDPTTPPVEDVLRDFGVTAEEIEKWRKEGAFTHSAAL
jgi:alpha-methylacyl-CoA racemase